MREACFLSFVVWFQVGGSPEYQSAVATECATEFAAGVLVDSLVSQVAVRSFSVEFSVFVFLCLDVVTSLN